MIVWVVAIVLATVAAICWWGSGVILHPPRMSPMSVFPEQFDLVYENFLFKTIDGVTLRGWFLPSPNGDERTLIMCHGWGDNKGELLMQTYFLNKDAGFNLLYFDFRSHGESAGEITTIGGLETRDFDAAAAWLRANKPGLSGRVGVFGLSMGAAVTVAAMPEHPELRCAVVESPFSDYRGVVRRWAWKYLRVPWFPLLPITLWILRQRVGDPTVDDFSPAEAAGRIAPRPLMIIGAERDDLMPEEDVRRIFDAARQPKELWIVSGAFHAKCREAAGAAYDARVTAFFEKNL